jgi:hypothetical protein
VDDLAVARAGDSAERVGALEDDRLVPDARERAADREPNHAGADHDRIDSLHALGSRSSDLRCVLRDPRAELRHVAGEKRARLLVADSKLSVISPGLLTK